ncbi:hypothetical protein C8J56DRAFT_1043877 [Mycena floridula]|nr:hypothetical protein C8J56DRAFT_1043877 [Mycena floridula]
MFDDALSAALEMLEDTVMDVEMDHDEELYPSSTKSHQHARADSASLPALYHHQPFLPENISLSLEEEEEEEPLSRESLASLPPQSTVILPEYIPLPPPTWDEVPLPISPMHETFNFSLPAFPAVVKLRSRSYSSSYLDSRPSRSSPLAGPAWSGWGAEKVIPKPARTHSSSILHSHSFVPHHSTSQSLPSVDLTALQASKIVSFGHLGAQPTVPVIAAPRPVHVPTPLRRRAESYHIANTPVQAPPKLLRALSQGSSEHWLVNNSYPAVPRFSRLSLGSPNVVLPVAAHSAAGKRISQAASSNASRTTSLQEPLVALPRLDSIVSDSSRASASTLIADPDPALGRSESGLTSSRSSSISDGASCLKFEPKGVSEISYRTSHLVPSPIHIINEACEESQTPFVPSEPTVAAPPVAIPAIEPLIPRVVQNKSVPLFTTRKPNFLDTNVPLFTTRTTRNEVPLFTSSRTHTKDSSFLSFSSDFSDEKHEPMVRQTFGGLAEDIELEEISYRDDIEEEEEAEDEPPKASIKVNGHSRKALALLGMDELDASMATPNKVFSLIGPVSQMTQEDPIPPAKGMKKFWKVFGLGRK